MAHAFGFSGEGPSILSRVSHFSAGARIYMQGDAAHSVLLIEQGIVTLVRCSAGGDRRVLAICTGGATLGFSSALTAAAHPVSARAVTETVIRGFDAREVVYQGAAEPSFGGWISRMLARESSNQLSFTASLTLGARQRLMRLFAIVMASGCGLRTHHGLLQVPTGLTHRDIAEAIWTTRETATRLLARLAIEGVARFDRGALIVSDASPLHRLAANSTPV